MKVQQRASNQSNRDEQVLHVYGMTMSISPPYWYIPQRCWMPGCIHIYTCTTSRPLVRIFHDFLYFSMIVIALFHFLASWPYFFTFLLFYFSLFPILFTYSAWILGNRRKHQGNKAFSHIKKSLPFCGAVRIHYLFHFVIILFHFFHLVQNTF